MSKRLFGLVSVIVLSLTVAVPPVRADTTRYWGYWNAEHSSWSFATTGPAQAHPKDGSVEGWRFTASTGQSGKPPRAEPDFGEICTSPAPKNRKRVAVVIDYGKPSDAPSGRRPPAPRTACAVVPEDATGTEVLAAVAKPRNDTKGLICTVDGYPAGACGTDAEPSPSTTTTAAAAAKDDDGSRSVSIGIAVILALAAVGTFVTMRRRGR